MRYWKLGMNWGTNAPDYFDLLKSKSIILWHTTQGNPKKGETVLLTNGHTIKALARLKGDTVSVTNNPHWEEDFEAYQVEFDDDVLYAEALILPLHPNEYFKFKTQDGMCQVHKSDVTKTAAQLFRKYNHGIRMQEHISILKQKGQIILQGPPGTGKTRRAKEIALQLAASKTNIVNKEDIQGLLPIGADITTLKDKVAFTVIGIDDSIRIRLESTSTEYPVSIQRVINCLKNNDLENPNQGDYKSHVGPYILGIASYLKNKLTKSRIKLLQFHPAYSYEDFVRGIRAKSNGDNIEYTTENRVLADFAAKALKNYQDSQKASAALSQEKWLSVTFDAYANYVQDKIDLEGEYRLTEKVSILQVEAEAFRYNGDWAQKSGQLMKFKDVMKLYLHGITSQQDIRKMVGIPEHVKHRTPYFFSVLSKFREFIKEKQIPIPDVEKVELQNYVLIIDEINRANLPSVLGELIYALEYRDEPVESIYDIEEDRAIILPMNLFIIGTMNTADRSVGHIDYAIRRRFAFIPVPPSSQVIEEVVKDTTVRNAATSLYRAVGQLFSDDNKLVASDFDPEDVQLGHSYFLADDIDILRNKLRYEIKPLLMEYVKDGILLEDAKVKIEALNV